MTNYRLPDPQNFQKTINGKNTHLLLLTNRAGMQVALTDYGARLVSVLVPDRHGNLTDVVLGFDNIEGYINAQERYHGATIGRYGNRIANGNFAIDDQEYTLPQNNGINCLHGGPEGFQNKIWDRQVSFKNKVDFYYISPDGEEGFPGQLKVSVSYELTNENEIVIHYRATTDKPTVINLTNHAYFNLNGEGNGDILSHYIHIPAEKFIPINTHQTPVGLEASVTDTAFDFSQPKKIVEDINADEDQIKNACGYDHTYVNLQPLSSPSARAFTQESGIELQVFTTEPGVHLYTGNFLADDQGKSGQCYLKHGGFCFETQHYPDSPNHLNFPSVRLNPGELFESTTIYKFCINK